ncbi:ankyrin repeat domain-containing protein 26-like isoform X2 [Syngnathus scovelli]|uniref:ankyrin repeat domain-containing protein 26-like isoform X2 n=1 Tax=Syngnathus scovelli TaxID=161590 RepID=UPI00210FACD2|nr:putative ankyrin repeat domain-containing protein 20A4 isoform X2 [Syngnathus scovelli]
MKKLFKFPRWKSSFDTCDCASVTTNASDIRENEMGKFHKAAWQGDMAKLEQLVKNVDINQLDKYNRTALHLACTRGNVEVVKFLIKKNAQVNLSDKQNKTPLIKAVQEQHDLCANILLENKADPNLVDSDGNTALHMASGIPSLSVIILLVKHGADVNVKNREGISPLTVAVQEDHIEVAEFLLKKGANVNILDRHRRSPLMLAAANGHFDMVRLLLKYKANVELKDSRGQSAESYAELEYHDTCSVLITEHRRRPPTSLLVLPSPSKRRSKSLELISIKDVGSVDRRSSTGGHKEELKRKDSEMSHLVKFLTQLDKGKTEKFDNEETGSEWDKASNASKRAVPEGSVALQNSEEFVEYSSSSVEAKRFEVFPKAAGRNLSDRGAKEPSQSLSVKNRNTAFELVTRRLEGHASEKAESSVSCKGSLLRNKEMSSPPDASSNSKKPTVRPRITSLLQRFSITSKPDEQPAEKISQLELVSKAHSSRAVTLNRDLPVNDDTLSDGSEDEGRSQFKQKMKKQRIDEMEISEELDEITSSSDGTLEEVDNQFRVKLEDFVSQPIKHPVLKSTDHHGCSVKVTKLKEETAQLKSRMEEAKDDHCVMEHKRMQMEAELANLRSSSKQQQEDCLNTIRMAQLNKSKLEEDLQQAHVQLSQERCTNAQLQQKLKSQDCKQQTIEEGYKRTKHNVEHLRTELEVTQAHSSTKQKDLLEENLALKEQLEDLRQDLRLTSDNHAQSVLEWNNLITGLKCEVTLANARLEAQSQAYSLLEAETQGVRVRLAEAEQLRLETEKVLLQEKDEQQRLRDKLASDNNKLSQKLSKAKAQGNSLEAQLTEKNAQIATLQRKMDKVDARVKEVEALLQTEKDLLSWAGARQEATQELLSKSESEGAMLRQKFDETQKLCVAKDIAVSDAQKCFSEILAKLRSDCEDRVQLVQDRNQDLAATAAELREYIHQLQEENKDKEASLKQLQKCETSLELHKRYHVEAEKEKARLHKEVDKLKQLEEVVHRQRALLKGAKRKLRDHQASEIMRDKVNELQAELRRQMSFRGLLEKNKSQLEEEVQSLRRRVEMNTVEHRNAEQYRREIEEKARQEIQKKIHEVNLFLQSQAATQEAQDQIKASTEVSLRSKIQELEGELKRSRSIQQDTIAQRDALHKDLKRYRQMHREEQWLRKSLSNDLKRSNSRLTEANSKLLSERCKSLVASAAPVPVASTSSAMAAPYRMPTSRILNPMAEGASGNVYLSKVRKVSLTIFRA